MYVPAWAQQPAAGQQFARKYLLRHGPSQLALPCLACLCPALLYQGLRDGVYTIIMLTAPYDSLHIGVSEPARAVLEQSSNNVAHYRPLKKPATEYGRLEERGRRLCSIVIIEKQACDWRLQKGNCSRPAAISQQCRVVPERFSFTAAKNTFVAFRG